MSKLRRRWSSRSAVIGTADGSNATLTRISSRHGPPPPCRGKLNLLVVANVTRIQAPHPVKWYSFRSGPVCKAGVRSFSLIQFSSTGLPASGAWPLCAPGSLQSMASKEQPARQNRPAVADVFLRPGYLARGVLCRRWRRTWASPARHLASRCVDRHEKPPTG